MLSRAIETESDLIAVQQVFHSSARVGTRHRILLSVLLVQTVLLFCVILRDPLTMGRFSTFFNNRNRIRAPFDPSISFVNDPKIGMELPRNGAGTGIRQIMSRLHLPVMLVPVGSCAGCLRADIASWETSAKANGLTLILLTSANADKADLFMKDLKLTCAIIFDTDNSLSNKLNVVWPARPYLISKEGRLKWMSGESRPNFDPFKNIGFRKALGELR